MNTTKNAWDDEMRSRRSFLRLAASFAVGAGGLLVFDSLINGTSLNQGFDGLLASAVLPEVVANERSSLITVKVYYTMMAQYTDLTEEDFVLESPARLQDLVDTCVLRHQFLGQMMGTMLILLDGTPSKLSASLRDGDTVQFIPVSAGG
jgi:molybdopterin converting factor small subunit